MDISWSALDLGSIWRQTFTDRPPLGLASRGFARRFGDVRNDVSWPIAGGDSFEPFPQSRAAIIGLMI